MKKSQLLVYIKNNELYSSLKVIEGNSVKYSFFVLGLPIGLITYIEEFKDNLPASLMSKDKFNEKNKENLINAGPLIKNYAKFNLEAIKNYKVYYEFKKEYPSINELKKSCPELFCYI